MAKQEIGEAAGSEVRDCERCREPKRLERLAANRADDGTTRSAGNARPEGDLREWLCGPRSWVEDGGAADSCPPDLVFVSSQSRRPGVLAPEQMFVPATAKLHLNLQRGGARRLAVVVVLNILQRDIAICHCLKSMR